VLRTAELLRHNDGRIFHTTYSLIWVRMLYDTYMMSGNRALLEKCIDALGMLLARFDTYVGENGLIENPPDYMFVDWIYIDDITIELIPVCAKPTACKLVTFTDNSITVAYEHDAAVKYEVKYGSVGFDPTTAGTVVESTEKSLEDTSKAEVPGDDCIGSKTKKLKESYRRTISRGATLIDNELFVDFD
jgi:hypothetical protein